MASMIPTRKVGGGALAGALVTIIISVSKDAIGYEMSPELAGALTTLVTFAVSYLIPEGEVKADA